MGTNDGQRMPTTSQVVRGLCALALILATGACATYGESPEVIDTSRAIILFSVMTFAVVCVAEQVIDRT